MRRFKKLSLLLTLIAIIGGVIRERYKKSLRSLSTAPDRHTSGPDTPGNVRKRRKDLLRDEELAAHIPA